MGFHVCSPLLIFQQHRHHIHRPAAPETTNRARPLPFLDKGVTPKRTDVDSTVASTGIFLIFPSFFFLVKDANHLLPSDLPGHRLPVHAAAVKTPPDSTPTRLLISICSIWDDMVCRLTQTIQDLEHGGLYLISLTEKIWMEECSNNRGG